MNIARNGYLTLRTPRCISTKGPCISIIHVGKRFFSSSDDLKRSDGTTSDSSAAYGSEGKLTKGEKTAKQMREKTPTGKLEDEGSVRHPYQEKEPLEPHPGGINPATGEIGGPRGPEPTRYGDWERKGRVTDF